MKVSEIFEPGHRKTTMTLIALVGSILLEKYGGGITGDLKEIILTILAIFTGGNVLSKGIRAVEEVKKSKQIVTDVVTDLVNEAQEDVAPVRDPIIDDIIKHVNNLDQAAGKEIKELKESLALTNETLKGVSDRLDKQVGNLSEVLKIINGMRSGTQPTA